MYFIYVNNRQKKYFQQQERNAQIQRQNRILFQKIQAQQNKNSYHHYKSNSKIRSSKTLNKYDDQDLSNRRERNYYNKSENKINYLNQQSRISFQQNQQLLRPKNNTKQKKILTQEGTEAFQSRILESKIATNQVVLFQGIAQIDTIKFKVKIFIRDKIYCLSGKNKHTDILLKMQINQYRKFHKEVLMGNPSNIFPYLMIDKGEIKFRTEQQENKNRNNKRIYQIEEEDEESQQLYKKYKQMKKKIHYKKQSQSSQLNKDDSHYHNHYQPHQNYYQDHRVERTHQNDRNYHKNQNNRDKAKVYYDYKKSSRNEQRHQKYSRSGQPRGKQSKSTQKLRIKQNISSNLPQKRQKVKQFHQNHSKADHYDRHRTLEDYINQNNHYQKNKIKSGQSTEQEVRHMKNRYKLPYL